MKAIAGCKLRRYRWSRAIAFLVSLGLPACQFLRPPVVAPPAKADPSFKLASTAGINYQSLQTLLRQRQWQAADQATFRILLQIRNREAEGWLSQADVAALDCEDLHTLAQLWDYYSDGRFGLIRQQQIWESLGGIVGQYTPELAERFGDRVGWRKGGQWLTYNQLHFSDQANEGHLPATTGNGVSGGVWGGIASISHRLKYCRLTDALARRRWVEADWETLQLFDAYRVVDKTSPDPAPLYISHIPCHELKAVDQQWLKYSQGRFGLSVQTRILKATGNHAEKLHWRRYEQFEQMVGWRIDPRVDDFNGMNAKKIPLGHFPYRLGYSYETFGSGFNRTWRLNVNPQCGL